MSVTLIKAKITKYDAKLIDKSAKRAKYSGEIFHLHLVIIFFSFCPFFTLWRIFSYFDATIQQVLPKWGKWGSYQQLPGLYYSKIDHLTIFLGPKMSLFE